MKRNLENEGDEIKFPIVNRKEEVETKFHQKNHPENLSLGTLMRKCNCAIF
jgi:hypothetical protein